MSFLIAILVIVAFSLSISYIFQKKFEYILPLTMAATSLLMYVAGLFGQRSVGLYLLITASVISVIYLIYKIIGNPVKITDVFKSSGFICFLIIIFVICIIIRGFVFSTWDEFSHWGLVIKNMYLTNDFGNLSDSTTIFKFYPPGVSLFLNFTTSFSKHFSEASALGGILALSYAQLIIIFTKIRHTDWKKILLITGVIFIAPLVFFEGFYSTIYVDAIMALIFANILYFNFSYQKKDAFYATYMSLQFYLLVSTKQIGIGLALIAFGAIIIDFIVSNKARPIKLFLKREKNKLVYILIPLLAGVISYISWKIYIKNHGISEGALSPSFLKLLDLFGPNAPPYRDLTIDNFVHNFFNIKQYGTISLSLFLWSIIIAFVMYCTYRIAALNKQRTFSLQLSTILGLYLYSGAILFMYLTAFSKYESTNLASVDRYIGTYLLCILILAVFILISYSIKSRTGIFSPNIKIASILIILLCIIPANSLVDSTILHKTSNDNRHAIRAPYEDAKLYGNLLDPKKDRIYVISQNNNGLDYYTLRYNFTPVPVQEQPIKPARDLVWSLGEPYSPNDLWTADISVDKWSKALEGFTYVYLYKIDNRFIDDYGQLFDNINNIRDTTMYHINKINNNIVLRPITIDGIRNQK